MRRRFEITDQEWERLAPLLPAMTPRRGGRGRDHRQCLNGILFGGRHGVAREAPPAGWPVARSPPGPQRHLVPGPHRGPLAGPARALWALGAGLQAVRPLADRWDLGPDRGRLAHPGGGGWEA